MNRVELEGVIAHELSHVKNYDILVSTLAVTMVGIVALLADIGVRMLWWGMGRNSHREYDQNRGGDSGPLAILSVLGFVLLALSPLIATVMQRAVSRRREILADVSGVEMTRYPPGLISALEKLRDDSTVVHATSHATAHLWIEQPAAQTEGEGRMSRLNRMFDTHPPIEERIALLREL
jgi:heat shock protein HtpX